MRTSLLLLIGGAAVAMAPRPAAAEACADCEGVTPDAPPAPGYAYDYSACDDACIDVPVRAMSSLPISITLPGSMAAATNNCGEGPQPGGSIAFTAEAKASIAASIEAAIAGVGAGLEYTIEWGVSVGFTCPGGEVAECKRELLRMSVGIVGTLYTSYVDRYLKRYCTYYKQRGGWVIWEWLVTDDVLGQTWSAGVFCKNVASAARAVIGVGVDCTRTTSAVDCSAPGCEHCCCGNGVKEAQYGEQCDGAGQAQCEDGQECEACMCVGEHACGDGTVDSDETCDPPSEVVTCAELYTGWCNATCELVTASPTCGDGCATAGESCGEPGLACPPGETCSDCHCVADPPPPCGGTVSDPAGDAAGFGPPGTLAPDYVELVSTGASLEGAGLVVTIETGGALPAVTPPGVGLFELTARIDGPSGDASGRALGVAIRWGGDGAPPQLQVTCWDGTDMAIVPATLSPLGGVATVQADVAGCAPGFLAGAALQATSFAMFFDGTGGQDATAWGPLAGCF